MVKISQLERTKEDETSKANALRESETKLNTKIAELNAIINQEKDKVMDLE